MSDTGKTTDQYRANFEEAEKLLAFVNESVPSGKEAASFLAEAQVHAILALAVAVDRLVGPRERSQRARPRPAATRDHDSLARRQHVMTARKGIRYR